MIEGPLLLLSRNPTGGGPAARAVPAIRKSCAPRNGNLPERPLVAGTDVRTPSRTVLSVTYDYSSCTGAAAVCADASERDERARWRMSIRKLLWLATLAGRWAMSFIPSGKKGGDAMFFGEVTMR